MLEAAEFLVLTEPWTPLKEGKNETNSATDAVYLMNSVYMHIIVVTRVHSYMYWRIMKYNSMCVICI